MTLPLLMHNKGKATERGTGCRICERVAKNVPMKSVFQCSPGSCPADRSRRKARLALLLLSAVFMPLLAQGGVAAEPRLPIAAPMLPPRVTSEPALPDIPAPPRLLAPGAPPDVAAPLVLAPAISTSEPIPGIAAGNCIKHDESGRFLGWMDQQHCVFSGRTLATARWFDDLFGDWNDDEASIFVRLITEMAVVESQGVDATIRLRASAALPNAKRRLRLVVTDDNDLNSSVTGREVPSQQQTPSQLSAALRWIPFPQAGFKSDFDIGVRGIDPPDIFARIRMRKEWGIAHNALFRFGQTFRYGSDSQGRSITQLDIEHAVDENSVARLSSAYNYDQKSSENAFNWGHGISLSHVLGDTRSLSYGFALNGHTAPNWRGESYGPWLVYRSGFLRSWLFYELEPRLTWSREQDWDAVASIVLRLEVQMGRK